MLKKSILLFTLLAIGVGIYFYLFVNQKSDLSEGFAVGIVELKQLKLM